MGVRPLATTAPSRSRWVVSDSRSGLEGTALGGRDRKERVMIGAMAALLVVQAFFIVRMVIG